MDIEYHTKAIREWVMRAYQTPPTDGELREIRVIHLGLKTSELNRFELGPDFTVENIDTLVNDCLSEAWDDAEGLGGIQKYKLECYFGTKKRPGRKKRFAMRADEENTDLEFSEPASSKGIVSQQMRHNEAMMKMLVSTFGQTMNMMGKQIAALNEKLEVAQDKNWQMIELREKMLSEEEERQLERVLVMKQEERKDAVVESVKVLLPSVMRRVTGKLLPANAGADSDMAMESLKALAKSLTSEQVQGIMSSLKPEQTVAFMEVLQQINQADEGKEESKSNG